MIRLYLSEDFDRARLLAPARYWAYATRPLPVGKRGKLRPAGVAWPGWNPSPTMETRSARLLGSGSFYWPCALACVHAAKRVMRADPTIEQIAIETISGVNVCRLYRGN